VRGRLCELDRSRPERSQALPQRGQTLQIELLIAGVR